MKSFVAISTFLVLTPIYVLAVVLVALGELAAEAADRMEAAMDALEAWWRGDLRP